MSLLPSFEAALNLTNDRLCLDFCNTVGNHASAEPREHLETYADLLAWADRKGLLPPAAAARRLAAAGRDPAAAEAVRQRALELREAVYRLLLVSAGHAHDLDPAGLETLNAALRTALAQARLEPAAGAYALNWDLAATDALDGVLWPVAYSAADLLATPAQWERIGMCQDDRGCGWLFLDQTKNHSRRWCAMDDCGNRAKAKRHYERQKLAI